MTTSSYPAVGTNGLTETQWAVLFGDLDGIVGDLHANGVAACPLTRNGDVATIGVGKVRVNNYVLDITSAHDLSLPAVAVSTTYYICAMYDPTLNVPVPNTDPPQASPDGPCRLIVSSGAPVTTGGKSYVTLYTVTRAAGQALTAAAVEDYRQWQGPIFTLPKLPSAGVVGFGPFPRGSQMWIVPGIGAKHEHYIRDVTSAGTSLFWRPVMSEDARAFPASSGLVANTSPAQFFTFAGSMVKCRGTLKRSSGTISQGSGDVTLGTFPPGFRPFITERFLCKTGSGKNYIEVRVGADGTVTMTGETGVDWIDISPICFRAEN